MSVGGSTWIPESIGKLQRHVKASIMLELGGVREEYQRKLPSTLGEIYLFRMAPKPIHWENCALFLGSDQH